MYPVVKASWAIIKLAIQHAPRVLLMGRPGTGKSTTATKILRDMGYGVFPLSLTEGDFSQSIFGRDRLDGKGGMEFMPSPAILAARAPKGALLLNEINRASLEVLSALYPFCDVGPGSEVVLPNNEGIRLPSTFKIVATMNGTLEELPLGLVGRFPVAFEVNEASPEVLEGLPPAIQKLAFLGCEHDKGTGVRIWHTFMALSASLSEEHAAKVLWGDGGEAILDSLKVSKT